VHACTCKCGHEHTLLPEQLDRFYRCLVFKSLSIIVCQCLVNINVQDPEVGYISMDPKISVSSEMVVTIPIKFQ
jgi:hypothetical protein